MARPYKRASPLGPGRALTLPCGWNNAGRVGVLVVGPNSKQFETVLMCYLSLMAREMFVRAFFVRTFILSDELSTIRRMILNNNEDPTYVHQVRDKLSKCSRDIIMMQGLLGVLTAATKELQLPKATRGGGAVNQARPSTRILG